MNYLTIGELKTLIKDMPDHGEIHFNIVKEDENYYYLKTFLAKPHEASEAFSLSLPRKRKD